MTLYSNFKTPLDASRAVKVAAGRNGIKIIGRPHNDGDDVWYQCLKLFLPWLK